MNILLTGGSGLIGSQLARLLIAEGHEVRILTREVEVEKPFYNWKKDTIDEKVFENLDGIIHLAGASLMNSWSKSYKEQIISSRVDTAHLLYRYCENLKISLKFFISASGSSFYGQKTTSSIFTENDKAGNDFLAEVCVKWENAALQFKKLGSRVVCLRTPLVLGKNADSLKLMKLPTQFGLGASLGKGIQWSPWIHIDDLCKIYSEATMNNNFTGSYNVVVSEHITHQNFMKKLAHAMGKPLFLPNIPSQLVKIGMGEKACLILEGSRLSNEKLLATGFKFNYSTLDQALKQLI